ncbi:hypothetical protein [Streptomyces sp. NPDC047123]|uniref:hypothetical protein n=1 Tax=Streptomyces sp. NPDC047123 TaxID=3155622 RepID=UPI0033E51F40
MKKSIAIATFALITLGTLGTTTAVANASTAPAEGPGHTVERPAGTGSEPAHQVEGDAAGHSHTVQRPVGTDAVAARQR